jgi:hypothetical protein
VSFSREWAMPTGDTFRAQPIAEFVQRYLSVSRASVDPFARNNAWATVTNDLNPRTTAEYHMEAEEFCRVMSAQGRLFDLAIFDPPYSPRQIKDCYEGIGLAVGQKETQSAALYKRVRDALMPILTPDATVLSFGWNSAGMGKARGFHLVEVRLVAHGGAHNDTICIAERRNALAAGSRRAKTPQAVECEASQSGPKGNAQ